MLLPGFVFAWFFAVGLSWSDQTGRTRLRSAARKILAAFAGAYVVLFLWTALLFAASRGEAGALLFVAAPIMLLFFLTENVFSVLLFWAAVGFALGSLVRSYRQNGWNGIVAARPATPLILLFLAGAGVWLFLEVHMWRAGEERQIRAEQVAEFQLLTMQGLIAGIPVELPASPLVSNVTAQCGEGEFCRVGSRVSAEGRMTYDPTTDPPLRLSNFTIFRSDASCSKTGRPFCTPPALFETWCARRPDLAGTAWCDLTPLGHVMIRELFGDAREAGIARSWMEDLGASYGTGADDAPIHYGCSCLRLSNEEPRILNGAKIHEACDRIVSGCGARFSLAPGVAAWIDLNHLPEQERRDALPGMIRYVFAIWEQMIGNNVSGEP